MKHIYDILTHHGRIMKRAADKADMGVWLMHHKFPGRVEPVFRRIRLDIDRTERRNEPNDSETGRPQGCQISDEDSSNENGGQQ
jgi:hypothetical protein